MDQIGVPQLHVCPAWHIISPNEVELAKIQTDYEKVK